MNEIPKRKKQKKYQTPLTVCI